MKEIQQRALEYINSFDDIIKKQFLKVLNGPVEEMGVNHIKMKCDLLGIDITQKIDLNNLPCENTSTIKEDLNETFVFIEESKDTRFDLNETNLNLNGILQNFYLIILDFENRLVALKDKDTGHVRRKTVTELMSEVSKLIPCKQIGGCSTRDENDNYVGFECNAIRINNDALYNYYYQTLLKYGIFKKLTRPQFDFVLKSDQAILNIESIRKITGSLIEYTFAPPFNLAKLKEKYLESCK